MSITRFAPRLSRMIPQARFGLRFQGENPNSQPLLTERYNQAMLLAANLHRHQVRKGTAIPYLSHLQAVSSLVLEHGGTEDEAIAALLHDAVEDQGGWKTLQQIRERFGDPVAEIVAGCSDALVQRPEPLPVRVVRWAQNSLKTHGLKQTLAAAMGFLARFLQLLKQGRSHEVFRPEKAPWLQRKRQYVAHLATAAPSVLLVSSADKLHNARSILADYRQHGDAIWAKFKGGKQGTLWYYDAILDAFAQRGYQTGITDELGRVVDTLKTLAGVPHPMPPEDLSV